MRLNPETASADLETIRTRERTETEVCVRDLPIAGATTYFWTMGSNLAKFDEFRGLSGNQLAKALSESAKRVVQPGPDRVTAEEYIRNVHAFDPDDDVTSAIISYLLKD